MDKKMDIIVKTNEISDRDEYLDNQDMCIMLGVTKKTLYRYRKKGILKLYTFDGRKVYYKKSEISENLKVREKNDNQNSSIYIHVVFMIIVITLI